LAIALKKPLASLSANPYDVVVVGAGPTGSHAAYLIAREGFSTLLLERENVPGLHNACGGGLGYFLKDLFEIPDHIVQKTVSKVKLGLSDLDKLYESDRPLYISVRRAEFDAFLARRAVENGAVLLCGHRAVDYDPLTREVVCLRRSDKQTVRFAAKIVIFADGPRTLAYRSCKIGLAPEKASLVGIAKELEAEGNEHDAFEFIFDERRLPYGYLWVFPCRDVLNVGIGGPKDLLEGKADRMLEEFIESRPDLRGRKAVTVKSGLIPSFLSGKLHGEGVMVIGDAAGFVNPLTGGGIFLGMKSAQIAAKTALEAIRLGRFDNPFLQRYTHRIKTSKIYASVKIFDALVRYSQWRYRRSGKPVLGKIFYGYSEAMFYLLKIIKDI